MSDKDNDHDEQFEDDVTIDDEEDTTHPQEALKKLRNKLKECEKQKQEYLTSWQRDKADFINVRRKDEEEKEHFKKFAKEQFVSELIPVLDSFEMAFSNKDAWNETPKEWRVGVEYIHSQFMAVLEGNDVKLIKPIGEEFDPQFHDALETVDVDNKEKDGIITDIVRTGYMLGDKVIRTAKVKVGRYKEQ